MKIFMLFLALIIWVSSCKEKEKAEVKSLIDVETIVGNELVGTLFLQDETLASYNFRQPNFQSAVGNYEYHIQQERRKENTGIYEQYFLVVHKSYLKQTYGNKVIHFDSGTWHKDQIIDSSFSYIFFNGMKVGLINEPRLNKTMYYHQANNFTNQVYANLNPEYQSSLHLCQHLMDLDFGKLRIHTHTNISLSEFQPCSLDTSGGILRIVPHQCYDPHGGRGDQGSCWGDMYPPLFKVGCSENIWIRDQIGRPIEIPGNVNEVSCGIMPVRDDYYYFLLEGQSATVFFYKRTAFPTDNVWESLRYLEYGNPIPFSIVGGTVPRPSLGVLNIWSVLENTSDFSAYIQLRAQINNFPIQFSYIPNNMRQIRQDHLLGTIFRTPPIDNRKLNIIFICQGNYEYQCDLVFNENKIVLRFPDYTR